MSERYEYELGKASKILVEELFKAKPGETFIITADTESDARVVDATARAVFAAGAKPMVIWLASPLGVGKAADPMLPGEALTAALRAGDAWVEYNNQWIFYSTVYDRVYQDDPPLRHLCLVGMNADMMVRCIGRIPFPTLRTFQYKVTERFGSARHVRMTTPAGGEVEFDNIPGRTILCRDGYAETPGSHMMAGQISWAPDLDSVNGVIVFDGSVNPPLGLLKEPVRLTIQGGTVTGVEGGKEAKEYETWLRSFHHPQMLRLAHVSPGFNPGARLTGDVCEDERIWGSTEWGIGNVGKQLIPGGIPGPSHSDGVCLSTSIWLDGVPLTLEGCLQDPFLADLAQQMGKR